ncbi:KdsC family phosphatase [Chitinophaga lutea]
MSNILEKFGPIRTFIFDVDGVLTDGTVLLLPGGEQSRKMSIRDGYALQLAVKQGYRVAIISGGRSESVVQRLNGLGVKDVFTGISNKVDKLEDYALEHDLIWEQVLFMGDDIPDYRAMQLCGLAACPADAAPEIKSISQYISPVAGGAGCVRDVIEKVLKLNGHWLLDDSVPSK